MTDKNIVINLSAGTFFKAVLVGLLFWLLYILHDLVLVLLTSVVIASAIEPATRWFGKYKIPRVVAVLFVYIALVLVIASILYIFVPPLFTEVSAFLSILPEYLASVDLSSSVGGINASDTGGLFSTLSETFSLTEVFEGLQNITAGFAGGTFQTISAVFGGVFSLILVIVLSFYLAVQPRGIDDFLEIITPVKHEKYVINLWRRSQAKIGKWMQGQLVLGLLVGILVYLGLTILGVPYALTLALLAAVTELIPVFGPIIAAVPAAILGFLDSFTLGLMVVGLYIIIQQFENHLIYPLVVRKVVGVPPLLVILALIIGAKLAGFLGIILSVPIAAAIIEFTDDIQKQKRKLLAKEEAG